ncbi:MAG TPA: hypothetical protein VNA28_08295 [Solirubrobacteraceae bacterium]|nr:hypothetical protein [Solirubrobacteraceae bacterium]
MKKVRSVVSAPFRFIGRLLLKLLSRLRALKLLGKPLKHLSRLRGRKLAIALVPIAIVVIVVVISLKPEPNREEQVRETLDRYAAATRDKDYQTLCDDLLASELIERIRSAGLPCEVALRTGLDDRQNPQLRVLEAEILDDKRARARVRTTAGGEPTSVDDVLLTNEDGEWRIASLTDPGSAAQAP